MMGFGGSRSHNSIEEKKTEEEASDDADRLSALPDDILLNILQLLGCLHWAVQTSILSRRWRRLPLLLSHLDIDISKFHKKARTVPMLMASYAEAVERLLLDRDLEWTIKVLRLAFYLVDDLQHLRTIGDAVTAAASSDAVEMTLLRDVHFTKITNEHPAVYRQRFMSFLDACPGAFGRVTALKLRSLLFADPDVSYLLSACHSLRDLHLAACFCACSSHTSTSGCVLRVDAPPTSQLVALRIVKCPYSRVELVSAPRLERLLLDNWIGHSSPPLRLGNVPRLHYIWMSSALLSSQQPFTLSSCLNTVRPSTLYLNFRDERVWVRPEDPSKLMNVFLHLNHLYLHDISNQSDLNWTLLLLEAAPSLTSFHLKGSWHACNRNTQLRYGAHAAAHGSTKEEPPLAAAPARSFKHHSLELLEIHGFIIEDHDLITYTRLVMERAVNLKRIRMQGVDNCKYCERLIDPEDLIPIIRECAFPRHEADKKLVRDQLLAHGSSVELIMERPQHDPIVHLASSSCSFLF